MIRPLYDWTKERLKHRYAPGFMAFISLIESIFFPIPPDVLLVPLMMSRRQQIWSLALLCTIASVLGAAIGYMIGFFLFDQLGQPLLEWFNLTDSFNEFDYFYNEWGWWIVVGGGLTPFPFKVITIASGLAQMNFPIFILGCLVSRGLRFFLEGVLIWHFGPRIKNFIEQRLALVTTIAFLVLIGGYLVYKFFTAAP